MAMRIVVAFHDLQATEALDLGEAFWLADTPVNRAHAEEAWAANSTHPNSAVFDWSCDIVDDEDILECFDDVCLHHPDWSEIRFLAAPLTPGLQLLFHDRGITAERLTNGFSIKGR